MQHSMSLVCVPLDIEDTLSCYRQALDRKPHCLQVFQHSRSLLLLLLTYTQSCEFIADWVDTHRDTHTHTHTTDVWNSHCLHCSCLSPGFAAQLQHCQSRSLSHSASLVDFSPIVMLNPNIQPCDLTEEDFSTPNAIYSLPISPDHMPTVTAAYSTSISKNTKYL